MTGEKVDKAWLDVARTAGRQDRDQEMHELRAEIERLKAERIQILNWLNTHHPHVAIAWARAHRALEPKP